MFATFAIRIHTTPKKTFNGIRGSGIDLCLHRKLLFLVRFNRYRYLRIILTLYQKTCDFKTKHVWNQLIFFLKNWFNSSVMLIVFFLFCSNKTFVEAIGMF